MRKLKLDNLIILSSTILKPLSTWSFEVVILFSVVSASSSWAQSSKPVSDRLRETDYILVCWWVVLSGLVSMSVSLVIMDRTIGQHSVCSSDAGRVYAEYCDDDATPGSIIPSHQYLLTTQNSDFQIQWWKRTKNHHFGRNKTFPKIMRNWEMKFANLTPAERHLFGNCSVRGCWLSLAWCWQTVVRFPTIDVAGKTIDGQILGCVSVVMNTTSRPDGEESFVMRLVAGLLGHGPGYLIPSPPPLGLSSRKC